ncbi:MAG: hypothetical protein OEV74_02525 [Cyclobacteriaceae bacterium]|jgi:hypothetical protein|nr:hypothetical protein [Cyclobacteriaceae bacterium]MDH4295129.1 hypothetical protein [Cyclobacteriaceae bacterium]MDH5249427.1 hypothetical protein [Cyclobacteriaceae bacterium]
MLFLRTPFKVLLCLTVVGLVLSLTSCGDDDPEAQSLTGKYQFISSSLRKSITVGNTTYPAGTDISDAVANGLFGVVTCADPANTAIDLQASGSLFFVCLSEPGVSPVQAGTWAGTENDTKLALNLSNPPFPSPITATVQGLSFSGNTLSGYILNLPMPGAALGEPTIPVALIDIDIIFEQQ